MYQKISLIGRLGKDPEMRYTPTGQAVTSFSIAVDQSYTQDGAQVKSTAWFRIQAWGKRGEVCNQYLTKGKLVYVEGKLQFDAKTGGPRIWKGTDELMHVSFEVTANDVKFLSPKDNPQQDGEMVPEEGGDNGEIPF